MIDGAMYKGRKVQILVKEFNQLVRGLFKYE